MHLFSLCVTGLGMSFCYQPSITCVQHYFHKRRALASSISYTGTGLGVFVIGPLWRWLMDLYVWRGMLLIHSGIMLNGVVLGALHRPILLRHKQQMQTEQSQDTQSKNVYSRITEELKKTWQEFIDPDLLRQPLFLLSLAAAFIVSFSHMSPLSFLPDRAQSHGIEV